MLLRFTLREKWKRAPENFYFGLSLSKRLFRDLKLMESATDNVYVNIFVEELSINANDRH